MERNNFTASDGTNLSYLIHSKATEGEAPKAILAIIHGIAYHAEPYVQALTEATPNGWLVAGLDLRGHGYSEGVRGVRMPRKRITRDIDEWLDRLQHDHPGVPITLLGESMGSVYALRYARKHSNRITGLVLLATVGLLARPQVFHWSAVGEFLYGLVRPFHPITNVIGWRLLLSTRDPEFVRMRSTDAITFNRVSGMYLLDIGLAAVGNILGGGTLSCPVLMVHGGEDKVVSPLGARLIAKRLKTPDTTLNIVEGAEHTVPWDPTAPETKRFIRDWLGANE
ncbi:MAG: alpha/beta fold hydrolase [Chloroflexi bacterium]|nr:alpha/beta fold hydrolase [Chloroflexota bacterium]